MRLSFMISSIRALSLPLPKPSAMSARPSSCSAPVTSAVKPMTSQPVSWGEASKAAKTTTRKAAGRAISRPAAGKARAVRRIDTLSASSKKREGTGRRLRKARECMTSVIKSPAFMLSPLQLLHFRLFRGASAIMRGATKTDLPENTSSGRMSRCDSQPDDEKDRYHEHERIALRRFPRAAARASRPGHARACGGQGAQCAADQACRFARTSRRNRHVAGCLVRPFSGRHPSAGGDLRRQSRCYPARRYALSDIRDPADGGKFRGRRCGDQPDLCRQ
ncbi:hypothetical protein D3C72_1330850 [compost metagenome]